MGNKSSSSRQPLTAVQWEDRVVEAILSEELEPLMQLLNEPPIQGGFGHVPVETIEQQHATTPATSIAATNTQQHEDEYDQHGGGHGARSLDDDDEGTLGVAEPDASSTPIASSSPQPSQSSSSSVQASASHGSHLLNCPCLKHAGFAPLHLAVCACSPQFVRVLLEAGAEATLGTRQPLSGRDSIMLSAGRYFYRDAFTAPYRSPTSSPLYDPSLYRDQLVARLPPDVKYREVGLTPIMLATIFASNDRVEEICSLLIQFGGCASLNIVSRPRGWSLAMFAAQRVHRSLYMQLLEAGMDRTMEEKECGLDALTHAANYTHKGRGLIIELETEQKNKREMVEQVLGSSYGMATVLVELIANYIALPPLQR